MVSRGALISRFQNKSDGKQNAPLGGVLSGYPQSKLRRSFFGSRFDFTCDVPLLRDRQAVVDDPVQHQTSREPQEEEGEDDWHHFHHFGLHRIRRSRVQALLDEHGRAHDDRQDKERVFDRQVSYPQHERSLAHFHAFQEYPVKRQEYRHLHQNRQASTQRVDLLFLVQLHHGLRHFLPVITMLFFQRGQFRGHGTHARHRFVAGGRQWEEDPLDQHRQEDDREAPVADDAVDMLQQPEDRLGNEPQDAVIHSQFQTWGQLFQHSLAFRAGIQRGAGFSLGTWCDGQRRASKTNDVVALAVFAGLNQVGFTLVRDPCGHEIVLQPGNPAALYSFFQRALVDIFHRHFFVRLATCPQGGAQVSRGAGGGAGRRIGTVVTLELGKQVARPRFGAFVVDQISDFQIVQTAGEAETLDVVDAVLTEFQVNV